MHTFYIRAENFVHLSLQPLILLTSEYLLFISRLFINIMHLLKLFFCFCISTFAFRILFLGNHQNYLREGLPLLF